MTPKKVTPSALSFAIQLERKAMTTPIHRAAARLRRRTRSTQNTHPTPTSGMPTPRRINRLQAAALTHNPETFYLALTLTSTLNTILGFAPEAPDLTHLTTLLNTWDMTTNNNPQPNN